MIQLPKLLNTLLVYPVYSEATGAFAGDISAVD